jgi:preprotein translocase subunit SecG
MSVALAAVHIVVCILLILIVLLQTGKGADIGAAFGGGSSQTLFGSAGPAGFFTKITTGVAVIFMVTSIALAYMYSHRTSVSPVRETAPAKTAPAPPAAPVRPPPPGEKGTPIQPAPAQPATK